jgi:hypothetical protein
VTAAATARLLALAVAASAASATVELRPADAQTWRPKKKAAPRKARPVRGKPARPAPADGTVREVPVLPEDEPAAPAAAPASAAATDAPAAGAAVTAPTTAPAADPASPGVDGDTLRIEDDAAGGDGDTMRIEDDLDDVGAQVDFSEGDLATDATGKDSGTRLDTKGLAYGRLGVDTKHSAPPLISGQRGTGEDVIQFRAHARAEGTGRFGERLKIKVAGRVDAELGIDADTEIGIERYEADVWDTHADLYFDWLDIRFGNQLITWGTADLISPNDVVNPRDLRRGIADRPDELRRPVLALQATAFTGPLALQAIWIPVAPANRFDLLDGDYGILGPHAATATERKLGAVVSALVDDPMLGLALRPIVDIGAEPDAGIETGELGAHGSVTTRTFDVHGYFLWGHERTPRIRLDDQLQAFFAAAGPDGLTPEALAQQIQMLAGTGVQPVLVDYPRRTHVGAAVATRLEPIGVKVDAAFAPYGNVIVVAPGAGPVLGEARELHQGSATLSIDYDRGTELSAVVEASYTQVVDVPADRNVFGMSGDHLALIGTSVTWTPNNGPLTLSVLGFVDVESPSYAVKPAVKMSGHDHLSVEIAAAIFGGPEGSFGGLPDGADEVSITIQYGL